MRLFIAADIPRERLPQLASLQFELEGWRWLPLENLHLTLAFLGEQPRPEPVLERLALLRHPPVSLETGPLKMLNRRVLALEVAGLNSLAARVHQLLGELHTEKRAFRGHLTVARARTKMQVARPAPRPAQLSFVCDSVSLQRSRLLPSGASYQTLGRFHLVDCPFDEREGLG